MKFLATITNRNMAPASPSENRMAMRSSLRLDSSDFMKGTQRYQTPAGLAEFGKFDSVLPLGDPDGF